MQPDTRVGRRLGHRLMGGPVERLGLRGEGFVRECAGGPQLRKDDEIGSGLLTDQRSDPAPARIDRFALIYTDLKERGAHSTTVLAFEPSNTGLRSSHESTAGVPHSSVT
ncbi:hypothetical protein GCM10027075_29600 [Streptomyces heilongjiangensis]